MSNRNLAGVAASTADMFVRIELAKARIPAFHIARRRDLEVKATIVGFMHFANGLMISCSRAWYYWTIHLSHPINAAAASELNKNWSTQIRVDGFAGGTDPSDAGVSCYHVDSQEGLNALVDFLIQLNGSPEAGLPTGDLHSDRVTAFQSFEKATFDNYPGMKVCQAPTSVQALAELEINALLLLGGCPEHIISNHRQAIGIAGKHFGAASSNVRRIREELATVLRSQINRMTSYYQNGATNRDVTDSYIQGYDLYELLTLRMKLLWQVGRGKEARSVKSTRQMMMEQLLPHIQQYRDAELKHLEVRVEATDDDDYIDVIHYRCAFASWRMAKLLYALGNREASTKAMREAKDLVKKLSPSSVARYKRYTQAA